MVRSPVNGTEHRRQKPQNRTSWNGSAGEVNGVQYNPRERVIHGVEMGYGYLEVPLDIVQEYPGYMAEMLRAAIGLGRCGGHKLFWLGHTRDDALERICIGPKGHWEKTDCFEPFRPEPDFAKTVEGIGLVHETT